MVRRTYTCVHCEKTLHETEGHDDFENYCKDCFEQCEDCGSMFLKHKVNPAAYFEKDENGVYTCLKRCRYCTRLAKLRGEEEGEGPPDIKEPCEEKA